ncbi:MAG: class I SAM-dependent methyltransferase, partial [Stackebrandtia sp.]
MNEFDTRIRNTYAGRAELYARTFGKLCAHPVSELLDAVGVAAGHRVLDVGCGSGSVSAAALSRNASVTAIDAEPSMVELTRKAAPEAAVSRQVLPDLSFADASFDAVVGNFVVNQVADPRAVVA